MDAMLEAARQDEVAVLNNMAQKVALKNGWATGEPLTMEAYGEQRQYYAGDQIYVKKNLHRSVENTPAGEERSLLNGTRAIITRVDDREKTVHFEWVEETGGVASTHRGSLTGEKILGHSRLGYAHTGHGTQGQTVDAIAIDLGAQRDMSATYVAVTRAKHDTLIVVNAADILEGEAFQYAAGMNDQDFQDFVLESVAVGISERGFVDEITAHGAVESPLFSDHLDPNGKAKIEWDRREHGKMLDEELVAVFERIAPPNKTVTPEVAQITSHTDTSIREEIDLRMGMHPTERARERRARINIRVENHSQTQTVTAGGLNSISA